MSSTNTDNTVTVPDTTDTTTETSERFLGIVKWFTGGHGFVTNFDTKEDVFVHHSNLNVSVDCWKRLYPGEYVDFSVGPSDGDSDKTEAKDVTGVRHGPLRCETNALLRHERDEYNREHNDDRNDEDGDSDDNTRSYRRRSGRGHNRRDDRRGNSRRSGGYNRRDDRR
jgi:cold shock CspA family protein